MLDAYPLRAKLNVRWVGWCWPRCGPRSSLEDRAADSGRIAMILLRKPGHRRDGASSAMRAPNSKESRPLRVRLQVRIGRYFVCPASACPQRVDDVRTT